MKKRLFRWMNGTEFTEHDYQFCIPTDEELSAIHSGRDQIAKQAIPPDVPGWNESYVHAFIKITPQGCSYPNILSPRILVQKFRRGYCAALWGTSPESNRCVGLKVWNDIPVPLDGHIPDMRPEKFTNHDNCCDGCRKTYQQTFRMRPAASVGDRFRKG